MDIKDSKTKTTFTMDHVTATVLDDEVRLTDEDGVLISLTDYQAIPIAEAILRRMRKS